MHDTARSGPCGLEDDHRGPHRTLAGAARERARRRSQHYYDTVARWQNANPARAYLHRVTAKRRAQGVIA